MRQQELPTADPLNGLPPEDEIDFRRLTVPVWAKRKEILRLTVLGAVLCTIVAFVIPKRFTATAQIMPPQQGSSVASALAGQLGNLSSLISGGTKDLGIKNPGDMYVGMLKSRTVEDAIINQFNLQNVYSIRYISDTRKKLEQRSTIAAGKDGIISIKVEDRDPKRSADIANAYVEQLKVLTKGLALTEAAQRRLFYEEQLAETKEKLSKAEDALKAMQQKSGLIQPDSQARATISAIVDLRTQIAAKEVELHTLQGFASPGNPDLQLVQRQLQALHTELNKLERQRAPTQEGDVEIPTGKVPELGLEYIRRLREVRYFEALYEQLGKQFEIAKLDESREAAVIQVLDTAVVPDKASFPKKPMLIGVGTLLVFLMVCGFFVVKAEKDDNLSDPPDRYEGRSPRSSAP